MQYSQREPITHSLGAVNVGSSIMALKYKDGVMIAADTAISYGGMCSVKDAVRIHKLNDEVAYASSGEMADFQNLKKLLDQKYEDDCLEQDGAHFLKPRDYFNYIARLNYQRRMKMDPLWVSTVVGGVRKDNGEVFLGTTDLYGTKVESNFILTGLSLYFCQVLMQNEWRADMSEEEARKLLTDCMRVMFYRDKKAHDQMTVCKVTQQGGVEISEPYRFDSEWDLNWFKEKTNEFWRPMRIRM